MSSECALSVEPQSLRAESVSSLRARLIAAGRAQDHLENTTINLIASDNACPTAYLHNLPYQGYGITEGLVGQRPFAGSTYFDEIEAIGIEAACRLFDAEHANLQPPSCSQANQAVYLGLLKNQDRVLSLNFKAGGHLTHGLRVNFSGRLFNFRFYGLDPATGQIDYEEIQRLAEEWQPRLLIFGSSSYPRLVDYSRLRKIADSVGSYLMGDLSHEAGLVAGGVLPTPFPFVDVMTCSLDKTLRGPHGGAIMCKRKIAAQIDHGVHPGTISSVLMRRIFHAALALLDADSEGFREYARRVIANAQEISKVLSDFPQLQITGGTDTHMIIMDCRAVFDLSGAQAEELLERAGVLASRQILPSDLQRIKDCSGLRIGTAWISSRGYNAGEARELGRLVLSLLAEPRNSRLLQECRKSVSDLSSRKRSVDVWNTQVP